jgi:hypothetical protein
VLRAWNAHGQPIVDGWIEFRLYWLTTDSF